MKEGWTWILNSKKWHYFVKGHSLCGRWMILSDGALELGNDNSPNNCISCQKKLAKRNLSPALAPDITRK